MEDDNRTIADMSMIEKPTLAGAIFGRRFDAKRTRMTGGASEEKKQEILIEGEERRAMIGGALKASLLIGLAYLVGIGAVIGVLVLIWVH